MHKYLVATCFCVELFNLIIYLTDDSVQQDYYRGTNNDCSYFSQAWLSGAVNPTNYSDCSLRSAEDKQGLINGIKFGHPEKVYNN